MVGKLILYNYLIIFVKKLLTICYTKLSNYKFYFKLLIFSLCLFWSSSIFAQDVVTTVAKKGNGVIDLLKRYNLSPNIKNIEYFQKINSNSFDKNGGLLLGNTYTLPINVVKFDGKTIRSTLNISDYETAKRIENYNIDVENLKLKQGNYKNTKVLWVPFEILVLDSNKFVSDNISKKPKSKISSQKESKIDYSFFQTKVVPVDKKLKDKVFYIISGHGGPDPGAVAIKDNVELHEHEYAYDVSIRLAKKLVESGADVYMIVQDINDGIREDQILKNGGKEKLINGDDISPVQIERLKQRTDIINEYSKKKENLLKKQMLVEIHVDSRVTDQRIDIFFYYRRGCIKSEKLNNILQKTIEAKYKKAQPSKVYGGNVTARDLFTLRNTSITASFIELGNIQNPADQIRIMEPNNRQAIANWLYDGILNYYK